MSTITYFLLKSKGLLASFQGLFGSLRLAKEEEILCKSWSLGTLKKKLRTILTVLLKKIQPILEKSVLFSYCLLLLFFSSDTLKYISVCIS